MGEKSEIRVQPLPTVDSPRIDTERNYHVPMCVECTNMEDDMNESSFVPVYHTSGKINQYDT